jgi:hypothetical protein
MMSFLSGKIVELFLRFFSVPYHYKAFEERQTVTVKTVIYNKQKAADSADGLFCLNSGS